MSDDRGGTPSWASGWEECSGGTRHGLTQEGSEDQQWVSGALPARAKDRHQDLLRRRPIDVRLPPQIFRLTRAGRIACSARQLVARDRGTCKKLKSAGHSRSRCAANRCTAGTVLGWSRMVWPRTVSNTESR
jgi:hypothetical protein